MVGSTPTGTIGAEPRKDVTFSYSGIASDAPVAFVPTPSGMLAAQHVRRSMRRGRSRR